MEQYLLNDIKIELLNLFSVVKLFFVVLYLIDIKVVLPQVKSIAKSWPPLEMRRVFPQTVLLQNTFISVIWCKYLIDNQEKKKRIKVEKVFDIYLLILKCHSSLYLQPCVDKYISFFSIFISLMKNYLMHIFSFLLSQNFY